MLIELDHADHEWKHGFFVSCLTPVLDTALSAQPQPYSKVLKVDRGVRNYHVPPVLDIFNQEITPSNRQLGMQQVLVSSGREIGTTFTLSDISCSQNYSPASTAQEFLHRSPQ